jgi:hypothetical protein
MRPIVGGRSLQLTGNPVASPAGAPRLAATTARPIKKTDAELQAVWAEVYAPGIPDSQGDFMEAETIREMAWDFMRRGGVGNIDVGHDLRRSGCYVIESFIARDDDPLFIPGSWVMGVRVPSQELWRRIRNGEINGFSIYGQAVRQPATIELDLPDSLEGMTEEAQGHAHRFRVRLDHDGALTGGETLPAADGHVHRIVAGTVTEEAQGHRHRFSFVEGMLHA